MNLIRFARRLGSKLGLSDNSPLRQSPNGSFVFIHINKTGGTSIASAIGLPNKLHLTAREVIDRIGEDRWREAYRFAVVRNPWDKVWSHYRYRVKTDQTGMGGNGIPFSSWLAKTYGPEKDSRYYDIPKMFGTHADWLMDHQGKIEIHTVIRFEELSAGFRRVCTDLGIQAELPHLNTGTRVSGSYRDAYDGESRSIVAEAFRKDLELWPYSFD